MVASVLALSDKATQHMIGRVAGDEIFGRVSKKGDDEDMDGVAEEFEPRRRFVLLPSSPLRVAWDLVSIGLAIFIGTSLPYRLAFVSTWSLGASVPDLLLDLL